MGVSYADQLDVAHDWRPLAPAEQARATSKIADASQMIRERVPLVDGLTVDERIADGSLSLLTVRRVVVAMVVRVMGVPAMFARQRSVTVDDATESVTFDTTVSGGEMFISSREMADLRDTGTAETRGQVAFMVDPGATPVIQSWI